MSNSVFSIGFIDEYLSLVREQDPKSLEKVVLNRKVGKAVGEFFKGKLDLTEGVVVLGIQGVSFVSVVAPDANSSEYRHIIYNRIAKLCLKEGLFDQYEEAVRCSLDWNLLAADTWKLVRNAERRRRLVSDCELVEVNEVIERSPDRAWQREIADLLLERDKSVFERMKARQNPRDRTRRTNARGGSCKFGNLCVAAVKRAVRAAETEAEKKNIFDAIPELIDVLPWYGPLWMELADFAVTIGCSAVATAMLQNGVTLLKRERSGRTVAVLHRLPERYGPAHFRLAQLQAGDGLEQALTALERARGVISRELIGRVRFAELYTEAALADKRGSVSTELSFEGASLHNGKSCLNAGHRAWIRLQLALIGRNESSSEEVESLEARERLEAVLSEFTSDLESIPEKHRALYLLQKSRVSMVLGRYDEAFKTLQEGQQLTEDWSLYKEEALLAMRLGEYEEANSLLNSALNQYPDKGALYALKANVLRLLGQEHEAVAVLEAAIENMPNSGELWLEKARMHLDPRSPLWALASAQRSLDFAYRLTPQCGAIVAEAARLFAIQRLHGLEARLGDLSAEQFEYLYSFPNVAPYGSEWVGFQEGFWELPAQILARIKTAVEEEVERNAAAYLGQDNASADPLITALPQHLDFDRSGFLSNSMTERFQKLEWPRHS